MKPEKSFVRQQSKERKDTLFIGSQDCSDYSGALSIYNASSLAGGRGNTISWARQGMQPMVLALKAAELFVVFM